MGGHDVQVLLAARMGREEPLLRRAAVARNECLLRAREVAEVLHSHDVVKAQDAKITVELAGLSQLFRSASILPVVEDFLEATVRRLVRDGALVDRLVSLVVLERLRVGHARRTEVAVRANTSPHILNIALREVDSDLAGDVVLPGDGITHVVGLILAHHVSAS